MKHRVHEVLKWAIGEGHRSDSPVDAAAATLPKARAAKVRHHAALPYGEVAGAIAKVRGCNAPNATAAVKLAFEFLVLTASRSGEVRGARWSEIDLEAALWVVRMKAGKEHRVPLSARALAVLREARRLHKGDIVFPNSQGKPLADYHLGARLLPKAGVKATAHGFRSSFRDWGSELSGATDDALEPALAHAIPNKAKAAYARSDHFEPRRALMDA